MIISLSSIISLVLAISKTEAKGLCTAFSPDCCWVVQSWRQAGQTTSVSPFHPTACCDMQGVTCSDAKVTEIQWRGLGIKRVPYALRKLTNLKEL